MSAANRRRGADAERSVVAWLRANGWPDARRVLAGDGRQDTDVCGVPGVAIEVKDRQQSAWPSWQSQALLAARDECEVVVVVRRLRGTPDVALWPARWTRCRTAWTATTFADAIETATNHLARSPYGDVLTNGDNP